MHFSQHHVVELSMLLLILLLLFAGASSASNKTRGIRAASARYTIVNPASVEPVENILELEELRTSNLEAYVGKTANYDEDNMAKGRAFMAKYSIIKNTMKVPETGTQMSLVTDNSKLDRCIWRAKKEQKKTSIRADSIFSESKLSFADVIHLAANFVENYEKKIEDVARDFQMAVATVVDYYDLFRDLCQSWCIRNFLNPATPTEKLGGPGSIVEIDETLLYKAKYHKGRMNHAARGIWIFGLLERGTNKVSMFQVKKRDAATLLPLIEANVAPGTTVISDSWRAYFGISTLPSGYIHQTINHKLHFVDPTDRSVHTQGIESTWSSLKRSLKSYYGLPRHKLDGYLYNYMFRRRNDRKKLLNHLIVEMGLYDPAADFDFLPPVPTTVATTPVTTTSDSVITSTTTTVPTVAPLAAVASLVSSATSLLPHSSISLSSSGPSSSSLSVPSISLQSDSSNSPESAPLPSLSKLSLDSASSSDIPSNLPPASSSLSAASAVEKIDTPPKSPSPVPSLPSAAASSSLSAASAVEKIDTPPKSPSPVPSLPSAAASSSLSAASAVEKTDPPSKSPASASSAALPPASSSLSAASAVEKTDPPSKSPASASSATLPPASSSLSASSAVKKTKAPSKSPASAPSVALPPASSSLSAAAAAKKTKAPPKSPLHDSLPASKSKTASKGKTKSVSKVQPPVETAAPKSSKRKQTEPADKDKRPKQTEAVQTRSSGKSAKTAPAPSQKKASKKPKF